MAGRCGCNGACNCAAASTETVATTGSGAASSPFLNSVRIDPSEDNLLGQTPAGLRAYPPQIYGPDGYALNGGPGDTISIPAACILDYNGDEITANPDGCVQLPVSGPPPSFGAGLKTDGLGKLTVDGVGTWPGKDLAGTNFAGSYTSGSGVHADADGKLRGPPEHTSLTVPLAWSLLLAPGLTLVTTPYTSAASPTVMVTNPSPARRMNGTARMSAMVEILAGANSAPQIEMMLSIGGGAFTAYTAFLPPHTGSAGADVRSRLQYDVIVPVALNQSTATSYAGKVRVSKTGAGGDIYLVSISMQALIHVVTV